VCVSHDLTTPVLIIVFICCVDGQKLVYISGGDVHSSSSGVDSGGGCGGSTGLENN
jgi:hypothetical protein